MNKQIFTITKINLLYLSFKVLSLYNNKYFKNKVLFQGELSYNFKMYNSKFLKYSNINEIKFILILYILSQNKTIQQLAQNIIFSKNSKYAKKVTAIKYFNKFKYLYYKNYNYYESNNINIDINYIAIINLYIIIECYRKNNIFFLIKYLYIPIFDKTI